MRSPYRCRPADTGLSRMSDWYSGPLGGMLFEEESNHLDATLPNLFGYYIVQVGGMNSRDLLAASRISHRIIMTRQETKPCPMDRVRGDPDVSPFASESLDVVVLPHTLEFEQYPHQVLREADRVLIPEGHVVILGFNPWSFWGLARLLLGWRGRPPWCGRFVSPRRIRDWLALLGFDIVDARHLFYRPPLNHRGLMTRLQFMERTGRVLHMPTGATYLLVARKRVSTLTPIRPRWKPKRSLVPAGFTSPTTRGAWHG